MVQRIEGRLPVEYEEETTVPLVYYGTSGEGTVIGRAHVKGDVFTAELDHDYTYFFTSLHIPPFSFVVRENELECTAKYVKPALPWQSEYKFEYQGDI